MERLSGLLGVMLLSLSVTAQVVVNGKITDTSGAAVENAIVKLINDGKIVGYSVSKEDGTYSVKSKCEAEELTLTVERLSYAKYSDVIPNRVSTVDICLHPQSTELREVTVSAPMIFVRGDTLTFRLDAFKGKEDISLKDAMRKIPGIEIAESGEIKYNGKSIKHFYIEGLDMLGGKYNIATDNIPANYVQAVQVLNNHKDAKIDKDEFTDDVAINIKLEPWAKFKPMGTYEASFGWGDRSLYRVGGAGMMFNKKFQTILTAKVGNVEEFSKVAVTVIGSPFEERNSYLESVLGKLSASQPPIPNRRYLYPVDKSVTINLLNKLSDCLTVKTDASYTYSKSHYDYSTVGHYFDGQDELVISQHMSPESRVHTPELSVGINLNSDKQYLDNRLKASASFFESSLPTLRSDNFIGQNEKMITFGVTNNFSTRWKRGRFTWGWRSDFDYHGGPEGHIDVSGTEPDLKPLVQTARTSSFFTSHVISMNYKRLNTDFYLPVGIKYNNNSITTDLTHSFLGESRNDVIGNDFIVSAVPTFIYTHPRQVVKVDAGIGLKGRFFNYKNNGSELAEQKSSQFTLSPTIYVNWAINARSGLVFRTAYNNNIGDVLDMLTAPFANDYLSIKARSGIISESRTLTSYLCYDYKMPVEMLFFSASVNQSLTRLNLLTAQSLANNVICSYTVDRPSHANNTSLNVSLTKQVQSIKTKFSVRSTYSFGRNEVFQNDEVIPYDSRNYLVGLSLFSNPVKFLSFNYNANFSKSFSSYLDIKRSFMSQSHQGTLNFFFLKNAKISVGNEMSWRELAPGNIKFISLLDADASYTFKSWRFAVKVSNIIDSRNYAYTVFSGLDNFTYDYSLRGREFLFSIIFTK